MSRVNIACFDQNKTPNVYGIWQWDYGQVLRIQGLNLPAAVEIHFSLRNTGGEAVTRIGVTKDGVTDVVIPDSMLEKPTSADYQIYVFIYLTDDTSGQTEHKAILYVKARPKPEAFDTPEEAELFREAIAAVNESADRAEAAQSGAEDARDEAQATAEGIRTDVQGLVNEANSAKNTAIENANISIVNADKTESDRAEVEALKAQAQTAAENALLSEDNAKTSETAAREAQAGAEAAEGQAELYAGQVEADKDTVEQAKALVMQIGQEVAGNKEDVEKTTAAFALTARQAVDDVNSAGQAQVERAQEKGTQAVNDITAAQTQGVKEVNDTGAQQVSAIKEEGDTQVANVQEAAAEIIADREQIEINRERIGQLGFSVNAEDGGLDITIYEE